MPCKNSLKTYLENGYYHIYNRGVEKRLIFEDDQDYAVFLSYLKTYLLPKDEKQLKEILTSENSTYKQKAEATKLIKLNNFCDQIKLIAYCLMPNHFHFLLKQRQENAIDEFMNSLGTRYTMFFNKKHKRVGTLYQGVYKAVLVDSEIQFLYLSSYIHRNPHPKELKSRPSSLPDYLGERKTLWVHPEEILPFFSKTIPSLSYKSFVEQNPDISPIKNFTLDF